MSTIQPHHLQRQAYVYLRQSTPSQVDTHRESTERQYALVDRAMVLGWDRSQVRLLDHEQLPQSMRRNTLPVKRIDGSLVMRHEHAARAVVELMQIGKTPSGADPVLQHTPEAFNRVEVVTAVGREEMQPKLLVPVGQRRRELFRPVDATAVGDHDHLFPRMAKKGHPLRDILP